MAYVKKHILMTALLDMYMNAKKKGLIQKIWITVLQEASWLVLMV